MTRTGAGELYSDVKFRVQGLGFRVSGSELGIESVHGFAKSLHEGHVGCVREPQRHRHRTPHIPWSAGLVGQKNEFDYPI